jgi:hypothetical protein
VMLTLYADCGANLDSPAPVPAGDLDQVDALARHAARLVREHLAACPCGGVRVTTWNLGRVIGEGTITRDWLVTGAGTPT